MSSAPKTAPAAASQLDPRSRWVLILGIVLAVAGAVALGYAWWATRPARDYGTAAMSAVGALPANATPDQILTTARAADPRLQATASGLLYEEQQAGTGERPGAQDVAMFTYTGRLRDGTVFDQSEHPVTMPIADVVPGFSEALRLMNRGSRYRVWLKPSLGYGNHASGPIPANSVLIFDLQLVDYITRAELERMQMMQAMQQMQAAQAGNSSNAAAPASAPGAAH